MTARRFHSIPHGRAAARSAWLPVGGLLTLLVAGGLRAGVPADAGRDHRSDPFAARPAPQPFVWRGKLAPGRTVEVQGLSGNVRAELAEGDQAEVSALKEASTGDTSAVRLEAVEHAGGVTVCALYRRRDGRWPTCRPNEEDHGESQNADVDVDFTVKVPRGVNFTGRTVQGDVAAEGLTGSVQVYSVNGSIRFSTSGSGEAETVNGSITASLGRTESPMSFSTVNGRIRLSLPRNASAELQASTMNGRITSDFPLHGGERQNQNHMQGTIGAGGARLELETLNGDIEIETAPTS